MSTKYLFHFTPNLTWSNFVWCHSSHSSGAKTLWSGFVQLAFEGLQSWEPFFIVQFAVCLHNHIEIVAFDSFQSKNKLPVINLLRNFFYFIIQEWKQLHLFIVWLLHVDEANITEHVEALSPWFVPGFALLAQVSVFGAQNVVSGVQVLNYVVLNFIGIRRLVVFQIKTYHFLSGFLVLWW